MKKVIASILALTMTAAMLTACGDSDSSSKTESSKAETTTTTAETTTTTEATTTTTTAAASEAPAESTAEGGEEAEAPKDISEMPATLANYEGASVTFEVGKSAEDYGLACMAEQNFENDESNCDFEVEEVAGVPMMKVTVKDFDEDMEAYKIPKIRFNMAKLFEGHTADLPKVFTVKCDIVTKAVGNFVADDGSEALVPGNFMGAFCTQPGESEDSLGWNQLYEFGEAEWVSEWGSYELVMRPGIKPDAVFADTDSAQYLTIMRWSIPNDACFYIADLRFEDESGNVIECPGFKA